MSKSEPSGIEVFRSELIRVAEESNAHHKEAERQQREAARRTQVSQAERSAARREAQRARTAQAITDKEFLRTVPLVVAEAAAEKRIVTDFRVEPLRLGPLRKWYQLHDRTEYERRERDTTRPIIYGWKIFGTSREIMHTETRHLNYGGENYEVETGRSKHYVGCMLSAQGDLFSYSSGQPYADRQVYPHPIESFEDVPGPLTPQQMLTNFVVKHDLTAAVVNRLAA